MSGISHHPIFTDPTEGDYTLFSKCVAVNKGDAFIGLNVEFDLNGNSRILDTAPDIGATELIP